MHCACLKRCASLRVRGLFTYIVKCSAARTLDCKFAADRGTGFSDTERLLTRTAFFFCLDFHTRRYENIIYFNSKRKIFFNVVGVHWDFVHNYHTALRILQTQRRRKKV